MNLSNILNVSDHISTNSIPITKDKSHINYLPMELVYLKRSTTSNYHIQILESPHSSNLNSTKVALSILLQYLHNFDENLKILYSQVVTNKVFDSKSHNERQHTFSYLALLQLFANKHADCKFQIRHLTSQRDNILTTLDQSNPKCTIKGIIHSLLNFLFGNSNSAKEIETITDNMVILKENQDILSSQTEKTLNFINLTYMETNTKKTPP